MTLPTLESINTPPKLGGWLIVLLVYLAWQPIAYVILVVEYLRIGREQVVRIWGDSLRYDSVRVIEALLFAYAFICAIKLLKLRWNAVQHVQRFLLLTGLVVAPYMYFIGQDYISIGGLIQRIAISLCWYAYLRFSKRVETTFPTDPFVVRVTAGRTE